MRGSKADGAFKWGMWRAKRAQEKSAAADKIWDVH